MSRRRTPISPAIVSRYFEAFLELLLAERGASANTIAAYRHDLGNAAEFLCGTDKRRCSTTRRPTICGVI